MRCYTRTRTHLQHTARFSRPLPARDGRLHCYRGLEEVAAVRRRVVVTMVTMMIVRTAEGRYRCTCM